MQKSKPVNNERMARILAAQFKTKGIKEPHEYVQYHITDNPYVWYIKVRNLWGVDGELQAGEYLFEVRAPEDITAQPPKFTALTPNGIYDINQPVCISIGEYHANQWQATLGMPGFCNELANGMMSYPDLHHGIAIIQHQTTKADKRKLAEQSRAYNLKHYGQIVRDIEDTYEEYSKKWDLAKIDMRLAEKLGLKNEKLAAIATSGAVSDVTEKMSGLKTQ